MKKKLAQQEQCAKEMREALAKQSKSFQTTAGAHIKAAKNSRHRNEKVKHYKAVAQQYDEVIKAKNGKATTGDYRNAAEAHVKTAENSRDRLERSKHYKAAAQQYEKVAQNKYAKAEDYRNAVEAHIRTVENSDEGWEYYTATIQLYQKLIQEKSNEATTEDYQNLAEIHIKAANKYSVCWRKVEHYEAAAQLYDEVIQKKFDRLTRKDKRTVEDYQNAAGAHIKAADNSRACDSKDKVKHYRAATQLYEEVIGKKGDEATAEDYRNAAEARIKFAENSNKSWKHYRARASIPLYEKLIQEKSNEATTEDYQNLAETHMKVAVGSSCRNEEAKHYKAAVQLYEEVIRKKGDEATAEDYKNAAEAHLKITDHIRATNHFIHQHPYLEEKFEHYEIAVQYYEKVIQIKAGGATAEDYRKAAEVHTKTAYAYPRNSEESAKHFGDATQLYEEVLQSKADEATAEDYQNAAEAHIKMASHSEPFEWHKHQETAAKYYDKAVEIWGDETTVEVYRRAMWIHHRLDNRDRGGKEKQYRNAALGLLEVEAKSCLKAATTAATDGERATHYENAGNRLREIINLKHSDEVTATDYQRAIEAFFRANYTSENRPWGSAEFFCYQLVNLKSEGATTDDIQALIDLHSRKASSTADPIDKMIQKKLVARFYRRLIESKDNAATIEDYRRAVDAQYEAVYKAIRLVDARFRSLYGDSPNSLTIEGKHEILSKHPEEDYLKRETRYRDKVLELEGNKATADDYELAAAAYCRLAINLRYDHRKLQYFQTSAEYYRKMIELRGDQTTVSNYVDALRALQGAYSYHANMEGKNILPDIVYFRNVATYTQQVVQMKGDAATAADHDQVVSAHLQLSLHSEGQESEQALRTALTEREAMLHKLESTTLERRNAFSSAARQLVLGARYLNSSKDVEKLRLLYSYAASYIDEVVDCEFDESKYDTARTYLRAAAISFLATRFCKEHEKSSNNSPDKEIQYCFDRATQYYKKMSELAITPNEKEKAFRSIYSDKYSYFKGDELQWLAEAHQEAADLSTDQGEKAMFSDITTRLEKVETRQKRKL